MSDPESVFLRLLPLAVNVAMRLSISFHSSKTWSTSGEPGDSSQATCPRGLTGSSHRTATGTPPPPRRPQPARSLSHIEINTRYRESINSLLLILILGRGKSLFLPGTRNFRQHKRRQEDVKTPLNKSIDKTHTNYT
ncbi:hypothetical protein EVAR_70943_1 [Eumeta japonica]|uniref:Uncharacterized protein n=1 Tax=Eumeta variegata TaxID=151549 RepID=A0A4C2A038_EUMVA|nr:hypothetical protein EVAR_70943_1 [Eumeta japonica]